MTAAIWSRGWASTVELGDGQERMRRELERSIRHPSRSWHDAPRMRAFGRSSSTANRLIHRLRKLGVIAIQPTLPQRGPRKSQGCHGGLRFTFGVRHWHRGYIRRRQLARISAGQIGMGLAEERARISRGPATSPPVVRVLAVSQPAAATTFDAAMIAAGFRPWWSK